MTTIKYILRGKVTRNTREGPATLDGFVERLQQGELMMPALMTAHECQADARRRGSRAELIYHEATVDSTAQGQARRKSKA